MSSKPAVDAAREIRRHLWPDFKGPDVNREQRFFEDVVQEAIDASRAPGLTAEQAELLTAAENMDWVQVVQNGGPPCFHLENGRFCGRAHRWAGHDSMHSFIGLSAIIQRACDAAVRAAQQPGLSAEDAAKEIASYVNLSAHPTEASIAAIIQRSNAAAVEADRRVRKEKYVELVKAANLVIGMAAVWFIDPSKSPNTMKFGFDALRSALKPFETKTS